MEKLVVFAHDLTAPDRLLLENLSQDIASGKATETGASESTSPDDGPASAGRLRSSARPDRKSSSPDVVGALKDLNDPASDAFEPTVFLSVDLPALKLPPLVDRFLLRPYVRWARGVARNPTDVVMVTHLLLYLATSVPSALWLFRSFSALHGALHLALQAYYAGTYTLMMHQHIHMRGVLAPRWRLFDRAFPYITDPLMGHTWNSYYYHHVKHHHVEGNGPRDLSSTLRYQRDSPVDFLCYLGRFYFFVWLELPLYFLSSRRPVLAAKSAFWEISSYAIYAALAVFVNWRATCVVFVAPLMLMRVALMVGNWGQHAFVDADEPDSDYRSSITLIDVASNRYCFNDGYHTSHHLNPLRHWRDHPASFLQQKHTYAEQGALVFHNIDYLMITFRLLLKDYDHLARCMIPIGSQISLSLDQRAALLRRHTRRFTEAEISKKFAASRN